MHSILATFHPRLAQLSVRCPARDAPVQDVGDSAMSNVSCEQICRMGTAQSSMIKERENRQRSR